MENFNHETSEDETLQYVPQKTSSKKIVIIAIAFVVALCVGFLVIVLIQNAQKEALKDNLTREKWFWINDGTTIYLEFDENRVEYSGDFGILGNYVLLDIEYEVVSPDTIRLYEYYDNGDDMDVNVVYRNIDNTESLKFTPSFINSDKTSLWTR